MSDYDDIGPVYNSCGLNLLAADYRGYGKSTGVPTVRAMLGDAHVIFREVQRWLKEKGMSGPLFIMGRSLGSVSLWSLHHAMRRTARGSSSRAGLPIRFRCLISWE